MASGKNIYGAVVNAGDPPLIISEQREDLLKQVSWLSICPQDASVDSTYKIKIPSLEGTSTVALFCKNVAWTTPENSLINASGIEIECLTGAINITILN